MTKRVLLMTAAYLVINICLASYFSGILPMWVSMSYTKIVAVVIRQMYICLV